MVHHPPPFFLWLIYNICPTFFFGKTFGNVQFMLLPVFFVVYGWGHGSLVTLSRASIDAVPGLTVPTCLAINDVRQIVPGWQLSTDTGIVAGLDWAGSEVGVGTARPHFW